MAVTAGDVPSAYDVVLSTATSVTGFCVLDSLESSLPFRTHRATYSFTPPFVTRQNVSGNYGDNQQDFFMTFAQNDWSLGEQQKFFRGNDPDKSRRYWAGTNVDLSIPGQVAIRPAVKTPSFAGSVLALSTFANAPVYGLVAAATSTNLYTIDYAGAITDKGAHGLGAAPERFALANDDDSVYIGSTLGGTAGVRRYSASGAAFSTFSTSGASSLCFLNNTLYGFRQSSGNADLIRYDTSGNVTSLYTWKTATGTPVSGANSHLRKFGGKLLILNYLHGRGNLWLYDGNGVSQLDEYPPDFVPHMVEVVEGVVFVSGAYAKRSGSNVYERPTIYYWANGTRGLLWRAADYKQGAVAATTLRTALCGFNNGLVFADDQAGKFMFYDAGTGAISTLGNFTTSDTVGIMAGTAQFFVHTRDGTSGYQFPDATAASSATVQTSLIDFDSSLDKLFRSVKTDFIAASDGNSGTVDIAYQVGDVTGSYTTLAANAASGTEYTLTGVSGRSVSVKVTLNKGTSTGGPVLKRIYVRAAPTIPQFRKREFVLDCSGTSEEPRRLRDGTLSPKTGREMVDTLVTIAQSTTPFTVVDRFGTYTNCLVDLADPEGFEVYEVHPATESPSKSGAFVVRLRVREV